MVEDVKLVALIFLGEFKKINVYQSFKLHFLDLLILF